MSTTTTRKREEKKNRIQGTRNIVFFYKCSMLDKVWEKGKTILNYFSVFYVVILAK